MELPNWRLGQPGHTASCSLGCSQLGISRGRTPIGRRRDTLQSLSPGSGSGALWEVSWALPRPSGAGRSHAGAGGLGKGSGRAQGRASELPLQLILHYPLSRPGCLLQQSWEVSGWETSGFRRMGTVTWTPPCGPCQGRGGGEGGFWGIILCSRMGSHVFPQKRITPSLSP